MMKFALMLTALLLVQMAYEAIDNALAPYEPGFRVVVGCVSVVFIVWFLRRALNERRRQAVAEGTGRVLVR
jgi:hypothetical protein